MKSRFILIILLLAFVPGKVHASDPVTVGKKLSGQFLTTEPELYNPKGYGDSSHYGSGKYVHYSTVSYWTNCLEFARLTSDKALEDALIARFEPFFGEKKAICNRRDHLDYAIFGSVPLEIYLLNGDERCLKMGLEYADAQWEAPLPGAGGFQGNPPLSQLEAYWKDGYSSHTRIWIDDMYMITILQTQAYRATGDYKYIERSARQMAMYLERIQNPDGLFHHAEGKLYVWGRGDGWMAAGMPILLKYMKDDDPSRTKILEGYMKMMSALLRWQRENGLWGQLVNDPESWDETSGSAMFAFGMLEGVRNGWLPEEPYGSAARRAFEALCGKLDANGNLAGVCIGTGARNDRDWYLGRPRVNGDPHGQAPMMWICNSLLSFPITYEQFGAVGDGVHDDQPAIVAAHAAANRKNLPVKATNGRKYYIGQGSEVAVIKTDVDFGTAEFIIDDIKTDNHRSPIFSIESKLEPFELSLDPIRKGQENLGVKLPRKCLVEVMDSGRKVYIRKGLNQNSGTSQKEMLLVEKDGSITPKSLPVWDYEQITKAVAYPVDDNVLTVKGGIFTTIANQAESKYVYRRRGIQIRRSNVRIEGLKHYVTGELDHGAPYHGFLIPDHCSDLVISDCLLTAHKTYRTIGSAKKPVSMGSYDISLMCSVGVLVEHCRQTTPIDDTAYWGIYTSNFCKDLTLVDCEFSRFDAHQGVSNVTLRDCKFGHQGVRMVGFGLLSIENCEIRNNELLQLRGDYGSSWEGEIVFRNCIVRPRNPRKKDIRLFEGYNAGKHDFGYLCCLPTRIVFDGLLIDDSIITDENYKGPWIFASFDRWGDPAELLPYPAEGIIELRGITVLSGKELTLGPNPRPFLGYKIVKKD